MALPGGYPATTALAFESAVMLLPAIALAIGLAHVTGAHAFAADLDTAHGASITALLVLARRERTPGTSPAPRFQRGGVKADARHRTCDLALKGALSAEAAKAYSAFDEDELKGFCHTIAFLWQIHPFYDDNTRTVAVFSELYLNQLGFDIANEPFEKHARYYRDALIRAIYRNAAAGI